MRFREGTFEHGLKVLADLRAQQCRTLERLALDPVELLGKAMSGGHSITILVDDEIAAMVGVTSESLIGLHKIWLITTPLIEREPVAFLRASRDFTKYFYELYGTLIGAVDQEFVKSKRWLEWIGFKEFRRNGDMIIMRYSGGH